ncbi:HNH endonuclease [Azohydromonas aeria]|uniref:HNH endonuclease n=1 Tax=Azohydromonas aeria TaxID=2590212 RepID=UPI0012F8DF73|nr:HNH endonuclease domain-containing protein [Azohydromonas aeria]
MAALPPPSAEAQLAFLAKLQRLFAEGDFTATYKFALLIALADLAVELGADDGQALELSTRRIGQRFIGLYWQQALAYGTGRPGTAAGILVQNLGEQAAVLRAIAEFRARSRAATQQQAALDPAYPALLSSVSATVSAQPLQYLQNFGGATDAFLYERPGPGRVRLLPGVAYCLRRFHPLVLQLARSHWVSHIKSNRRNHAILGDAGDLEDFLFSTSRQSLEAIGAGLRKLDGERCFYCGLALGTAADVDHYVPFSLYPRDLAHNFVLAHPACNRSKADSLAGRDHLERWLQRVVQQADALSEIGLSAGIAADAATSHRVAAWSYASAAASGGHAWLARSLYEAIDQQHVELLTAAPVQC